MASFFEIGGVSSLLLTQHPNNPLDFRLRIQRRKVLHCGFQLLAAPPAGQMGAVQFLGCFHLFVKGAGKRFGGDALVVCSWIGQILFEVSSKAFQMVVKIILYLRDIDKTVPQKRHRHYRLRPCQGNRPADCGQQTRLRAMT